MTMTVICILHPHEKSFHVLELLDVLYDNTPLFETDFLIVVSVLSTTHHLNEMGL